MDATRTKEQTLGTIMAMHRAVLNKCPMIVLNERARIEEREFCLEMLGCTDCHLIHEDEAKVPILTVEQFIEENKDGKYSDCKVVVDEPIAVLCKILNINPEKLILNKL